jgi:signal transduction histidine kinase
MVTRLQAEVNRLTAAKAAMEERQRLARELHDSVSQSLFSIELNAGAAEALMERDPARARQRISRLRGAAHEALNDLRALIAELHPPALEGKTLEVALREYAAALQEREGLEVTVDADVTGELDRESQAELFGIGYEALTNVVKHAHARHAWIGLTVRPPAFRLSVSDDGVGMDPTAAGGQRTFGVSGMTQRAAILGARLTIGARTGGGVQVVVER